ncbi:kinase-like protein [Suhomyces tanzawaensis NRRL Y-17324]|uniref:Kinase-like protein n=1 Tax=Suhomyces tanzawaensis NRRL Y-17324 TaxID=984487 RepID=A0A1E4SK65_9ASCO|nr:kinase-like protein [Suhomyces tanzawaensis NRRL Y-17324]ODV79827.1 kinase-like protein [Suhomyces tanzawaensis NRRL Y-17324]
MSSYNYNFNRHNSIGGNWHLPPLQGLNNSNNPNQEPNQDASHHQKHQAPGFRNPWYSPGQQASGAAVNLSQSPTKSQGIPLLQQHQHQQSKRLSFANQLPTTYEYDQRQLLAPPYIHPPTRADNPFNQYYTNQEVSLAGNDRRMSAAVDGPYYNSYNSYASQNAPNAYQAQYLQNPPAHLGPPLGATRRSSVATGSYAAADAREMYYPPGRMGRSPLIVQYQQYQQALQSQRSENKRRPAPKAYKVYNKLDLKPKIHHQPKYRRCSVNSIHISPVNALSVYLTESYSICQPRKFQYSKSTNPKRVLTKPLEPKFNNGHDNEDSDYILYVNDILGTEEGRKYIVLDLLGSGTFGQVVKCQNLSNQSVCAVKVIKSKPAYMNQSLTEVKLLEFLNANSDGKSFIRLLDTFMHKEHLCLVFELLASNLYELIKQNQFQGLNIKLVKLLTRQLLEAMSQLKGFQMIHCDLKPENILLCQPDKPDIKVIDFGSACFSRQTIYTYIQSRFYRSPEVILGLPYTESIDMWSLGCIVGELFLGLPMFPGTSEYNQIWKIVDMLGYPPRHMIEVGRNSLNFFEKAPQTTETKPSYQVKSFEQYVQFLAKTKGKEEHLEQPNKNYFKQRLLKDIIMNYKLPSKKMTNMMIEKECQERLLLIDFLTKVLNLNPLERLTPQEALKHPFVNDVRTIDTPSNKKEAKEV